MLEQYENVYYHGAWDAKQWFTAFKEENSREDDLLFCPHHPDHGFPGEALEYKMLCSCRKPEPGMLLQAAERYHIALIKLFMIGDGERDIQARKRANCRTLRVSEGGSLYNVVMSISG